jgi:hypothetical protein
VYKNGLREIKIGDNTMTENMKDCVLNGNHFHQIFLDHDDSMRSYISPVPVHSDDEDPPLAKFSGIRPKKEQLQEEQAHQLQEEHAEQVQVLQKQAEQDQEHEAEQGQVEDALSESEEESEEDDYIPGPPQPGEYMHTFQFEFRGRRKTCRVLNMDAADGVGDSVIHDSDEDFNPQLVDSDIDL